MNEAPRKEQIGVVDRFGNLFLQDGDVFYGEAAYTEGGVFEDYRDETDPPAPPYREARPFGLPPIFDDF